MTSVYHSSSSEIPPTIIASPPSFSTLVETTVIKGNDIHPNSYPPIDSHPNYVDISPTFLTPEKKINCFSGNFPFDSDFEAMPLKEVVDAFLEWYSKGMNMKRENSPSSDPFYVDTFLYYLREKALYHRCYPSFLKCTTTSCLFDFYMGQI
ncbi:hypothetical protein G4B88_002187 [Cannabis sativa]|uniref:Uncharacterized protein n=1 Tax=Cannabis sativa TaxID=3483 RepID=A0A7J6E2N7_CANSA|nr:hypothetical protein G4B88_002187 [Cannabis sativa]